jgi:hypothetical protein
MPSPLCVGAEFSHSAPRDALARGIARFAAAVRRLEPDMLLGRFLPGMGWPAAANKVTTDLSESTLLELLRTADAVGLVGDPDADPHGLEFNGLVRNWEQDRGMPTRYLPLLRGTPMDDEGGGYLNLFGPRWTATRAQPVFTALVAHLPGLRTVTVRPHEGPPQRWMATEVRAAVGLGGESGWLSAKEEARAPSEERVYQLWNGLPGDQPVLPWLAPHADPDGLLAHSRQVAGSLVGRRLVSAQVLQHFRDGIAIDPGHGPFELRFDDGAVAHAWPCFGSILLDATPLPERAAQWPHPSGATDSLALRPLAAAPIGSRVVRVEEGWPTGTPYPSSLGWALRFDTGAVLRVHHGLRTPEATISTHAEAGPLDRGEAFAPRWEPVGA